MMTDTGGETAVEDVYAVGQRRRPGGLFPPGVASGTNGPPSGVIRTLELAGDDLEPPSATSHPCDNPDTAIDWNADAAAASTTDDLDNFSKVQPAAGGRGFNEREYGAGLWQRTNGSVVRAPMAYSAQTFAEAAAAAAQGGTGRPFVEIDWTPPELGAVPIASVHSHGPEAGLPSGNMHNPTAQGDVGHLFGVMALREFYNGRANGFQARIYIATKDFGEYETEGPIRIYCYDQRNIAAAVGGQLGPEVNPDGQACGQ